MMGDEFEREFRRYVRENRLRVRACMGEPMMLSPTRQALVERIRNAFGGLRVGAEVNLYLSGEALDGCASDELLTRLRKEEVRDDWQKIPVDLLFACSACFSFIEPEGIRYLLPAAMVATMRYPQADHLDLNFYLTGSSSSAAESLSLLDANQRACVTDFMNEMRAEEGGDDGWLMTWDGLLPWEKELRATTAPKLTHAQFAIKLMEEYLRRMKHSE